MQSGVFTVSLKNITLQAGLILNSIISQLTMIFYIRYQDDVVILAKSRWELRRSLKVLYSVLSQLKLEVQIKVCSEFIWNDGLYILGAG